MFDKVQDSGKRQQFETGSQRDTDEGKGNPSLVAWEAFLKVKEYKNSSLYALYIEEGESLIGAIETLLWRFSIPCYNRHENDFFLYKAINLSCLLICEQEKSSDYTRAYKRLAVHYQNGAKKYNKNNWRLGQYISRYYDSAMRHLWKISSNINDEDHYSALLWNLVAIVQTKIDVEKGILSEKLNDFPFLVLEIKGEEKNENSNKLE